MFIKSWIIRISRDNLSNFKREMLSIYTLNISATRINISYKGRVSPHGPIYRPTRCFAGSSPWPIERGSHGTAFCRRPARAPNTCPRSSGTALCRSSGTFGRARATVRGPPTATGSPATARRRRVSNRGDLFVAEKTGDRCFSELFDIVRWKSKKFESQKFQKFSKTRNSLWKYSPAGRPSMARRRSQSTRFGFGTTISCQRRSVSRGHTLTVDRSSGGTRLFHLFNPFSNCMVAVEEMICDEKKNQI